MPNHEQGEGAGKPAASPDPQKPEKPKRMLTELDLRLGIGLTDEYLAEVTRRLAIAYAPIIRRILAEQAREAGSKERQADAHPTTKTRRPARRCRSK